MVNFIPDPDLQQILPPLLSHIPAAFSSPKAPPSLPPLLAPILRSRVEHLSFGNTPWLQLVTWGSVEDSERLYQHLVEQDYFFLQSSSSTVEAARCSIKGFRRLDADTISLAVDVDELGIRLKFLFVINDENGEDDGWKLMDVRLLEDVEEEERMGQEAEWSHSVGQAEETYRSDGVDTHQADEKTNRLRSLSEALGGGSGTFVFSGMNMNENQPTYQTHPITKTVQDEDEDDDYWAQYDDIDGDSSRGDEGSHHSPSSPTTATSREDDYYARYNDVQPALDNDIPPTPPPHSESNATPMPLHNRTASANINEASDASTRSSNSPPRSSVSTPLTVQTSSNHATASAIHKLERQAELHVQGETAIKQHVATTMKSLYRLWRAAGLEREEFEGTVAREIDMLAMMEEDDDAGSFGSV